MFSTASAIVLSLTLTLSPAPRHIHRQLEPPVNRAELHFSAIAPTDLSEIGRAVASLVAAQEVADVVAYIRATEPVYEAPEPVQAVSGTGGDEGSDAWFARIAICESGGVNGWRTGLYGIEAGYPIGDLSPADQLAWAKRIYSQYGASAWGCKV